MSGKRTQDIGTVVIRAYAPDEIAGALGINPAALRPDLSTVVKDALPKLAALAEQVREKTAAFNAAVDEASTLLAARFAEMRGAETAAVAAGLVIGTGNYFYGSAGSDPAQLLSEMKVECRISIRAEI